MLIEDQKSFDDLVARIHRSPAVCLDTEFISEHSYRPRLCLLQLGFDEAVYAVDPFRVSKLDSFLDVLMDPNVEKVVHSGQQDMMIFFDLMGTTPESMFDTQVAAALLGHGESIGYARLVDAALGVRLPRDETFTDWSQRPLTSDQIAYALDDVRYLMPLHAMLMENLESLGRLDWLNEEMAIYKDVHFYGRDPKTLHTKIRGAGRLTRAELAVLRELARWREDEARQKNSPRSRVVGDEVLCDLARRQPSDHRALAKLRGLHPRLIKRSGDGMLACIAKARKLDQDSYPESIPQKPKDPRLTSQVDLLEVFLKTRAAELKISPGSLATRSQLYLIVDAVRTDKLPDCPAPVLQGWRRDFIGQSMIDFLYGAASLRIDPKNGGVRITT